MSTSKALVEMREREEGQLRKDALQNVETLFLVSGMETSFLISYYC